MGYIDNKDSVDVIRSIYEYRRTKRDFKLLTPADENQRDYHAMTLVEATI